MDAPTTSIWTDILHSPPVWIAAVGAFIKWVVSPALTAYTRKELDPELKLIAMIPILVERQKQFDAMPEALSRIESELKAIREKKHG